MCVPSYVRTSLRLTTVSASSSSPSLARFFERHPARGYHAEVKTRLSLGDPFSRELFAPHG